MSERSVAELIGWVIEDNPWYTERTAYREEPKRLRANGEYWLTSKRPTVDDLLAWLMADRHLIPVIQIDRVERVCSASGTRSADVILHSGLRTKRPAAPAPPIDIVGDVPPHDISYASASVRIVCIDDLRTDADLRAELAR